ncbi:MAG: flavin binding monooxygenase [Marmoricola sp.]|nr:flavin binding monooxygenase [Marmoricola sp.]
MSPTKKPDHVSVLIIGAGLSGIGAAAHLKMGLPELTYAILEGREAIGGTWDLFRYPGVRSDSDMHTLGYRFRPWRENKILADGPSIKKYVEETADEYGVPQNIRFGHKVLTSAWDSATATWTIDFVTTSPDGQAVEGSITANFLWNCTGYYNYDEPFTPDFPGIADFQGQVLHPQQWPEDLDYEDKRVVIIGSGATAITMVPAMAGTAGHVTMLQRSPTYVLSLPSTDPLEKALQRVLPEKVSAGVTRWRNVSMQAGLYQISQRRPKLVRRGIRAVTARQLPKDYDVDTHFNPAYNPWDQRLCVVPDGDLFRVIRKGQASIETGVIDTFVADGIKLTNGQVIEADIVVTATGLNLLAFGGMDIVVDGEKVTLSDRVAYKGSMLEGVPNFAYVVGYTNASWTLKADLISEYVVRVLKTLRKKKARSVVPVRGEGVETQPLMGLTSGYVQRSIGSFPAAGTTGPWRVPQNYFFDLVALRHGKVTEESLQFKA